MNYNIPRTILKKSRSIKNYLEWFLTKNQNSSVYFYTFHKCASTLFSTYVLKNVSGLRHIDYANKIYFRGITDNKCFEDMGYIYGPIRLSVDQNSLVYKYFVKKTLNTEFIKNKTALFLIRDPRDILVSSYYSFGFIHGFSPVMEIKTLQEQTRKKILNQTIDQYVSENAQTMLSDFKVMEKLNNNCKKSVIIKYEDMIDNWDKFVIDLTRYIDIDEQILDVIHQKSRPRQQEDITSHHRSGKSGEFRSKLKPDTITHINEIFGPLLQRLQYQL